MNPPEVFRPREGQRRILAYEGGLMGVAAVPGSGKTTTIAHLAAELLEGRSRGEGPLPETGRVLVVTYQAAAADALRGRIARGPRRPPAAPRGVRGAHPPQPRLRHRPDLARPRRRGLGDAGG